MPSRTGVRVVSHVGIACRQTRLTLRTVVVDLLLAGLFFGMAFVFAAPGLFTRPASTFRGGSPALAVANACMGIAELSLALHKSGALGGLAILAALVVAAAVMLARIVERIAARGSTP